MRGCMGRFGVDEIRLARVRDNCLILRKGRKIWYRNGNEKQSSNEIHFFLPFSSREPDGISI